MKITFENLPQAIQSMQQSINSLTRMVQQLQASQAVNEPPITGEILRSRLNISRPTEIDMRKRGKLPYLKVNGHYRYNWSEVLKSITA